MIIIQKLITSLFCQTVYMSLIATVIGSVIAILRKVMQKKNLPKYNYILWVFFVIALVFPITLPSRLSIYNYIDVGQVKLESKTDYNMESTFLNENAGEETKISEKDFWGNKSQNPVLHEKDILADIWFGITGFLLVMTVVFQCYFQKQVGNQIITEKRIVDIFERCKKKLKIKKQIKLVRPQIERKKPCTVGVFDVKILLDDEILCYGDEALTSIIMHELCHYKRKDRYVSCLIGILSKIHWFNPVISKLFTYMRADIEYATDEMSLNELGNKGFSMYCKTMGVIATENITQQERVEILGFAEKTSEVSRRIDIIFVQQDLEKRSLLLTVLTAIFALSICLVLYPSSYASSEAPKLYLKSERGQMVQLANVEQNTQNSCPTLHLKQGEKMELVVGTGNIVREISKNRIDLNKMQSHDNAFNVSADRNVFFEEKGNCLYEFGIKDKNNRDFQYQIKIIVE